MLFNSLDFAVFLPIVFIIYWILLYKSFQKQNLFILISSYVFYGWWDWRFLLLIFFSSILDFNIGLKIRKSTSILLKKYLLGLSIIANISLLVYFKYANFFIENFIKGFSFFNVHIDDPSLNIILPVGISFYTFQTLSYTIDVYRNKISPVTDIVQFLAFVSFFPQLVAGPIERASNLLPQFKKNRYFNYKFSIDGLRQILWGFFKKIVIADNCAIYANDIFNNYENLSGGILFLGAIFFAIQIYGDFSGYSDIAIGVSKLFGFSLKQNFAFPYFSRNIGEFWRKWHISLSTWFRDYVYIPLGGSRRSKVVNIRNIFIVFSVSGLWHGANWTYLIWGIFHSILFIPSFLLERNRNYLSVISQDRFLPNFHELILICRTFIIVVIAWIFFRSESIQQAFFILKKIVMDIPSKNGLIDLYNYTYWELSFPLILIILFLFIIEWIGRHSEHPLERIGLKWKVGFRWAFYYVILYLIIFFATEPAEFIYFQF